MEFLTIQETMEYLNISRQSVYNAINRGALTGYKKYGKMLLDAAEVSNFRPNKYRDKRQVEPGDRNSTFTKNTIEGDQE